MKHLYKRMLSAPFSSSNRVVIHHLRPHAAQEGQTGRGQIHECLFHLLNELLSPTITRPYETPINARIPRCEKISLLVLPEDISLQIMRAYRRN